MEAREEREVGEVAEPSLCLAVPYPASLWPEQKHFLWFWDRLKHRSGRKQTRKKEGREGGREKETKKLSNPTIYL